MATIHIRPYRAKRDRRARKGQPRLAAGTRLYLLEFQGRFFCWSYVNRLDAERVRTCLLGDWADDPTRSARDWEWCFLVDAEACKHVAVLTARKRAAHTLSSLAPFI